MSVNKGLEPIINKRYVDPLKDWQKIKTNLKDKRQILDAYDDCISESLWETNHKVIMRLLENLNIKVNVVYDEPTDELSNDRLISICKKLGATTYLAGSGGKNYMNLEAWKAAGIDVQFQVLNDDIKKHVLDVL